jgi:predicted ATPase
MVRANVSEQLGRLGSRERRILAMAAVLGMEFELAPLAAVVGAAPEKVLRSLLAAESVHVVCRLGPTAHRFRFAYPQVREALYADLGPRARARHHLRAARALERSARAGPALLAYHFCEAAAVGGAERGVEAACEAARRSASRGDFERASVELQQALSCLDFIPDASPLRRCEILLDAARAAAPADPRRAGPLLVECARIARRLGEAAQPLSGAIAATTGQLEADAPAGPA